MSQHGTAAFLQCPAALARSQQLHGVGADGGGGGTRPCPTSLIRHVHDEPQGGVQRVVVELLAELSAVQRLEHRSIKGILMTVGYQSKVVAYNNTLAYLDGGN